METSKDNGLEWVLMAGLRLIPLLCALAGGGLVAGGLVLAIVGGQGLIGISLAVLGAVLLVFSVALWEPLGAGDDHVEA